VRFHSKNTQLITGYLHRVHDDLLNLEIGCAVAQAVRSDFSPWRPVFNARIVHVGFMVVKVALSMTMD
jgi:hypothetical protein